MLADNRSSWNRARVSTFLALLLACGGCTATPAGQSAGRIETGLSVNPVLALAQADFDTWEQFRNDVALGQAGSPVVQDLGVAVVRQYEFLRNVNGRPRNDSWTFSRSVQRLVSP